MGGTIITDENNAGLSSDIITNFSCLSIKAENCVSNSDFVAQTHFTKAKFVSVIAIKRKSTDREGEG